MKFNLMIILLIFTHRFKGHEISSRRSSPLLESYGCLERTNITLFVPFLFDDLNIDLLTGLEDPCFSMFFFYHHSRKIVQWNGNLNEVGFERRTSDLSESEILDFIESLYKQQDATTKQILIIAHEKEIEGKVLKAIELLDRETEWNVIVTCRLDCPILQHLPINRIVPIFTKRNIQKRLKNIVKNPDFNENEFLTHIKVNNVNLTCLANKTVHVFMLSITVELLQNTVLIVNNTQGISPKIILYAPLPAEKFWTYYIEINGWKNIINIVFQRTPKPLPQKNTDEVYLIDEDLTRDVILIDPYFDRYYGRYFDRHFEKSFCIRNDKSFVLYKFQIKRVLLFIEVSYVKNSTCGNFERVSFNTNYDTREEFSENFIGEVLSASCF